MSQLLAENWILLAIALVIGLVVAWFLFRTNRRTRVTGASKDVLDEGAERAQRNSALVDSAPAARRDADPTPAAAPAAGADDDLSRIKGVGPKLVAMLHELGVTSFGQIAAWDDAEIDRIDAKLGRFQGRIRRDDWVGQARLLNDGKSAEFKDRYGSGA